MGKVIIFDFDGTIVDSLALAVSIYNQMSEQYNLRQIVASEIAYLKGLTIKERMKLFDVPFYMLPKMAIDFKKRYEQNIGLLRAIDGMPETILELKRLGYPLSIISSNAETNIRRFLKHTNIDVFDHIYSSKALFGKQSVINQMSKKNNIAKENMIYIGDEQRDIVSCQKADVQIIAVTWGFDSAPLLASSKPHFMAHTPAEIIQIVSHK